jgi:hypothetical protein
MGVAASQSMESLDNNACIAALVSRSPVTRDAMWPELLDSFEYPACSLSQSHREFLSKMCLAFRMCLPFDQWHSRHRHVMDRMACWCVGLALIMCGAMCQQVRMTLQRAIIHDWYAIQSICCTIRSIHHTGLWLQNLQHLHRALQHPPVPLQHHQAVLQMMRKTSMLCEYYMRCFWFVSLWSTLSNMMLHCCCCTSRYLHRQVTSSCATPPATLLRFQSSMVYRQCLSVQCQRLQVLSTYESITARSTLYLIKQVHIHSFTHSCVCVCVCVCV